MRNLWKQGLLIALVTLSLSACSIGTETTKPETKPAGTETKKEEKPVVKTDASKPGEEASTDGEVKVGTKVAAEWISDIYYSGVIDKISGDDYDIQYDDGFLETHKREDFIVIPSKPDFKTGDKVLAVWMGTIFYPGIVQEMKSDYAIIQWNDGTTPSEVKFGKIVLQPKDMVIEVPAVTEAPVVDPVITEPTAGELPLGARVASKWADGNYFAATIIEISGSTYSVQYDDGTSGENPIANLIPLSEVITLNVGDKVLAVWSSASGRLYEGTVQEVNSSSAVIKWDDGSDPSEVPFGSIVKQ